MSPRKAKIIRILVSTLSILLILITITGTIGFFTVYLPVQKIIGQVSQLEDQSTKLKLAISDKDINQTKTAIDTIQKQINLIDQSYQKLSFLKPIPKVKDYYQDGLALISIANDAIDTSQIVIKAVEPYADFLGITGVASDSAQTTEDRIAFLTQSVEGLIPHLNDIETKVASIDQSIQQIDPNRYPEEYRGRVIKSQIAKAQTAVNDIHQLVKNGRPILAQTPWLLGKDSPRTYLMIFQNDAELRPTGGFWTAYGTIRVDKGKITPLISEDIYHLDAKYNSTIPAPRPIKAYHINVPYWNIRDMNISPDFPTSIQLFLEKYQKVYGTKDKIDAVIGIDTQVLVDIVKVIGRVGVPGWGNFSSDPDKRCDGCPQIIYQLEWLAGRPRDYIETNRKGFLSPLMHSLLSNAMGAEKSKIGPLMEGLLQNIHQKHLLFYFTDPDIQSAAAAANIAGQINPVPTNGDYLHLSQANMSSAKTNLFLKTKIKHEIISTNDKIEHKITVTYQNPSRASNCNLEKGDLCLNAPKYREWFRFFTNPGSTLVKMTGSEVEPVIYDELGKQIFEGFFGNKYPLYAQSTLKTSIQYTSSTKPNPQYTLNLQKQPGTKAIDYQLIVNGQSFDQFDWVSDKSIRIPL